MRRQCKGRGYRDEKRRGKRGEESSSEEGRSLLDADGRTWSRRGREERKGGLSNYGRGLRGEASEHHSVHNPEPTVQASTVRKSTHAPTRRLLSVQSRECSPDLPQAWSPAVTGAQGTVFGSLASLGVPGSVGQSWMPEAETMQECRLLPHLHRPSMRQDAISRNRAPAASGSECSSRTLQSALERAPPSNDAGDTWRWMAVRAAKSIIIVAICCVHSIILSLFIPSGQPNAHPLDFREYSVAMAGSDSDRLQLAGDAASHRDWPSATPCQGRPGPSRAGLPFRASPGRIQGSAADPRALSSRPLASHDTSQGAPARS